MPPKLKKKKPSTAKKSINPKDCPLGYHYVIGHFRKIVSGFLTWVHEHFAKNPGHQPELDPDSIEKLVREENTTKSQKIGKICGFKEHEELDPMIHFWLDYWKRQGLSFPSKLTPRIIKAMIAKESSFDPHSQATNGSARGLMQIKKETRDILAGKKDKNGYRELKNYNIIVSSKDLFDPNINVACGIRWISHKFKLIPKKMEKNLFNTLKNYNDWKKNGESYAKEILALSEKKCP